MWIILSILLPSLVLAQEPVVEFDGERGYINGVPCRCVPHYLCDANLKIMRDAEARFTGWGQLDTRAGVGDEGCIHTTERCCMEPDEEPTTTTKTGCGYRNPEGADPNFSFGKDKQAKFGEFPWVVEVSGLIQNPNSDKFIGGGFLGAGALIHPRVVITAANTLEWVTLLPNRRLSVRAGEWERLGTREPLQHQDRMVAETVYHDGFSFKGPGPARYNIALLRLQEPFQLDIHINVVCLPNADEDFTRAKGCFANGWGLDEATNQDIKIMKKEASDMVSRGTCEKQLTVAIKKIVPETPDFLLHKNVVCSTRETTTCNDDGGGPLTCPSWTLADGDRYQLVGLPSAGVMCALDDVPALFVYIPAFRTWIDSKMAAWGYDSTGYTLSAE